MSVFRYINIRIETCHHVYLQCPTIVKKKKKEQLKYFRMWNNPWNCWIGLQKIRCTPAWIILHPRTLRIRTHSPTTRKVSSCKTRCSLAKGLRNVWNNATGNNAECPLFVWCFLDNVFGINSLTLEASCLFHWAGLNSHGVQCHPL